MKIISLTAEHVKRLRVVSIRPDGAAIVLAGENEQGKSSILDAIEMALAGKRTIPPVPIHTGEKRARIVVDMGDYKVTRTITPSGSTLEVQAANGTIYKSPQAVLDKLMGDFSFDPMHFVGMEPKQQTAILRQLAGVNTDALDQQIKDARDERRAILDDLKLQREALDQADAYPDAGLEPVSPERVAQLLEAAKSREQALAQLEIDGNRASGQFEAAGKAVKYAEMETVAARAALESAQVRLADAEAAEKAAREQGNEAYKKQKAALLAYETAIKAGPDADALRLQVVNATETNRRVQANINHAQITRRLNDQEARAETLKTVIEQTAIVRAEALTEAAFPVPGLGIDEDGGILWNGLPFEQASEAVRVRVSVAIGLALNPQIKVLLIRNGNDLGSRNLHAIAEMAEAAGAQVWIERIAGGDGLQTVVIEDGAIVGGTAPVMAPASDAGTGGTFPAVTQARSAPSTVGPETVAAMAEAMPTLARDDFAPLTVIADGFLKGGPANIREKVNEQIQKQRAAKTPPPNAGDFE